jgi:uncharacterized protein YdeI (YjbR/CyaY-like superfamily)
VKEHQTFCADTLDDWRGWLERNHATENGVWLVIGKKGAGNPSVSDTDAAEEALCFGWVDSLIRHVDDSSYMKLFTPRKDTAKWSAINIERVKRLIVQGRMQAPGLAKISGEVLAEGYVPYTETGREMDEERFLALLAEYPAALKKFKLFPASSRRNYCLWVLSAKREDTRRKRAEEAAAMITKNIRSFMK